MIVNTALIALVIWGLFMILANLAEFHAKMLTNKGQVSVAAAFWFSSMVGVTGMSIGLSLLLERVS